VAAASKPVSAGNTSRASRQAHSERKDYTDNKTIQKTNLFPTRLLQITDNMPSIRQLK